MAKPLIDSVAALEQVVGRKPAGIDLKVIDHLDDCALRWIACSPLMFAGFGGNAIGVTLGGGEPGFAHAARGELRLPAGTLDDPSLARPGCGFGSLFLVPGIGEALRVNGRVTKAEGSEIAIAVEECYMHCAKALIRSAFWSAQPDAAAPAPARQFVAESAFMALATCDADGNVDLSPKGDPPGRMALLDETGTLHFADRPGNRRTDSFRNILTQPGIAGALLIPGACEVALFQGVARLTTDEAERERFTVNDRVPLLVVDVEDARVEKRHSPALQKARLWPSRPAPEDLDAAEIFTAHLKLNKDKSLSARIASAAVSVPGLMRKGLERDYKSNLY